MVAALAQVVGFLAALTLVVVLLDRMEPESPAPPVARPRRRHRRAPVAPPRTGLHEGGAPATRTCCRTRSPRRQDATPLHLPAPTVPAQRVVPAPGRSTVPSVLSGVGRPRPDSAAQEPPARRVPAPQAALRPR